MKAIFIFLMLTSWVCHAETLCHVNLVAGGAEAGKYGASVCDGSQSPPVWRDLSKFSHSEDVAEEAQRAAVAANRDRIAADNKARWDAVKALKLAAAGGQLTPAQMQQLLMYLIDKDPATK